MTIEVPVTKCENHLHITIAKGNASTEEGAPVGWLGVTPTCDVVIHLGATGYHIRASDIFDAMCEATKKTETAEAGTVTDDE